MAFTPRRKIETAIERTKYGSRLASAPFDPKRAVTVSPIQDITSVSAVPIPARADVGSIRILLSYYFIKNRKNFDIMIANSAKRTSTQTPDTATTTESDPAIKLDIISYIGKTPYNAHSK